MFQQIRQGSQLYIYHKEEHPRMEMATVTFASQPKPKFQTNYNPYQMGQQQELFIDLTVKLGDQTIDMSGLPATADTVDLSGSGKPMIVTSTREAMMSQAESVFTNAKQIVDSRDYNLHQMQGCEEIMQQLNPQLAQSKQQDQKLEQMSKEMFDMKSEFGELKSMFVKFMSSNKNDHKQQSVPASNPKNN